MPQTYTVKKGDTLSAIGAKYGVAYSGITGYKSGNPNLIYPGEVLTIPDKGSAIPPKMNNTQEVANHLNEVQNNAALSYTPTDIPKVRSTADIAKEIKGLLPTNQPEAPNLVDSYNTMRKEQGLDVLEQELNDLTTQQEEIIAIKRQRTNAEMDKPVATNVIAGRVGEVERQENERLDVINRTINTKSNQLKNAYTNIQTIMDLTDKDYDNAKESYDTQFRQAMDIFSLARGIRQDEVSEVERAQDVARANAQILVNSLKDGGVDYSKMSTDQKLSLAKMEVQAGLPVGFFSSIKKDPKADIISTTEKDGQIQVLMRNPDGTLGLQTYGTKNTSTGVGVDSYTPKQFQEQKTKAINLIKDVDTNYRTVNGKIVQAQTKKTYDKAGNEIVTKPQGDRILYSLEADMALQKIIDSVGGNVTLGEQLFSEAIKGFKVVNK